MSKSGPRLCSAPIQAQCQFGRLSLCCRAGVCQPTAAMDQTLCSRCCAPLMTTSSRRKPMIRCCVVGHAICTMHETGIPSPHKRADIHLYAQPSGRCTSAGKLQQIGSMPASMTGGVHLQACQTRRTALHRRSSRSWSWTASRAWLTCRCVSPSHMIEIFFTFFKPPVSENIHCLHLFHQLAGWLRSTPSAQYCIAEHCQQLTCCQSHPRCRAKRASSSV